VINLEGFIVGLREMGDGKDDGLLMEGVILGLSVG